MFRLLILFFISSAFACDFKGVVRVKERNIFVVIHEGTLSEEEHLIPKKSEFKFLTYKDLPVKGTSFTELDFATALDKDHWKGECK